MVVVVIAVLLVLVVIAAPVVALVAGMRRSRSVELEPGPAPSTRPTPPAPAKELDDATVAEIEEALAAAPAAEPEVEPEVVAPVRPSFRDRLAKARGLLSGYVSSVLSRSKIDDSTWDDLEEALIRADVGVGTTADLLDHLRTRVKNEGIAEPEVLVGALKDELKAQLEADRALTLEAGAPNVWLFVGVNGVGKTTTIGKVGKRMAADGHKVVMAAGDTFRAAAAEQLELWAHRVGADLVRGDEGGDPSSVIFDAVQRAAARDADLVLADTAGRLHTKVNLMEELRKVRRVADREPGKVTEVLLVLDATTGQNGLVQAKQFTEAVDVTGVVLTKLDGSAKGGIVLAIQRDLGIPVKLVGLGETADDLVDFDAGEFVDALFA
jgi:fused signal recognition particle receptor